MKKIVLVFISLFILSGCSNNSTNEVLEKPQITDEQLTGMVVNYDMQNENIDLDFLKWIYSEYGIDAINSLQTVLDNNSYNLNVWHELTGSSLTVLLDLYNNNYDNMNNVKIIDTKGKEVNLSFVGDVSLADNFEIIPKYDERGEGIYGILSEEVVNIMNTADIMVANNEFTISDRGEPMPNKYYTFRANTNRVGIYNEMGVDLVTLANNHVYDFGKDAFLDTLDTLTNNNIPYVGAGRNIEEASRPYYFIANGYKIAFVNATRAEKFILTPEATDTTGGVLRAYDPTRFKEAIKTAKENSDFVIALIHWGKEDSHELEQVQIDTGKEYIDAGADILIGTHAHTLQGIEFYNNKPIIYNIGDFIFNRESKDTGILNVKIDNQGNFTYSFTPCYQHEEKTSLLNGEDKQRVLNKLRSWSINTTIDDEGNFYQTN